MAKLSLEAFDRHIENLRAQLQLLNEALEATDHHAPEWLGTTLLSLRNKSGKLQDDMTRFRDQLEIEGLAERQAKNPNKRLSIEGAKAARSVPNAQSPTVERPVSPSVEETPTPKGRSTRAKDEYIVQHIDVTEEVNRRLRESRLRRLMETPSTAQKRKFNAYDESRSESTTEAEDELGLRDGQSGSEYERTPTKRLKSSGTFEQMGKRKENDYTVGSHEQPGGRSTVKRRRV